jgi:2-oxoglutarate ferredoxin oxidoreductase subunit gamma
MYRNVMEKIGKPIVFNICMLGVVIALTKLVKPDSIMEVLKDRLPEAFIKMNRDALDLGMKIAVDNETR